MSATSRGTVARGPTDEVAAAEWIRGLQDSYWGALYVFAYRALADHQAAEEVVQDTLARAWRSADRFDPAQASAGTWLFAIARNLVIDHHRRRSVRPPVADAAPAPESADLGGLDRAMEAWQMAEALQRLAPEHRSAIVETYYRGASIAEAASRLGIPPGTVKSRLYYGLRALRLALQEMGAIT